MHPCHHPAAGRRHGRLRLRQVHRRRRARPAARRARSPTPTTSTRRPTSPRWPPARPLDDHDRRPWLETIGALARRARRERRRDQLLGAQARATATSCATTSPGRSSCTCTASREVDRRAARPAAPATSCPPRCSTSQFATLEPLEPDEPGVVIDVDQSVDADRHSSTSTTPPRPGRAPREGDLMSALTALLPLARRRLVGAGAPHRLAAGPRRPARHRADRRADHRRCKVHPFLALTLGALTVGVVAGRTSCMTDGACCQLHHGLRHARPPASAP